MAPIKRQAKTSVTSNGKSPDDKQECSASTLEKQLDTSLQEKETASGLIQISLH